MDDRYLEDTREDEDYLYEQELRERKEEDFLNAADYYYESDGDR
jgi:hypothetical protein